MSKQVYPVGGTGTDTDPNLGRVLQYFACDTLSEITDTVGEGDVAYERSTKTLFVHNGVAGVPGFDAVSREKFVNLTSDQAGNSTSFADVTGMSFPVAANGIYSFEFTIIWKASATSSGIGLGITGPSGFAHLGMLQTMPISFSNIDVTYARSYDQAIASSSVNDANADMVATLKGLFVNGANAGTIQLRKKNQGGNVTTTILAGSILRWQKEN